MSILCIGGPDRLPLDGVLPSVHIEGDTAVEAELATLLAEERVEA